MEHESAQARLRLGFIGGFALLICVCVMVIVAMFASIGADRQVEHSMLVRQTAEELLGTLQEAETGQRGYLLTGDPSYVEPFYTAKTRIPLLEERLRQLSKGNSEQQVQLDRLYALIAAKMDELSNTVQQRQTGRTDAAMWLVRTNLGRNLMQRVGVLVGEFDRAELKMLRQRSAMATLHRTLLTAAAVLLTLLAGAMGLFVMLKARRYANDMRDKNKALQEEMAQREAAEQQLRQAQKMEALGQLTGGVAHDFNNMLSVMMGNLEMLQKRLPEEDTRCRAFADNALTGAQRAAELTRRLLAFSRQQPLQPKSVDVNQCVQDISVMLRRSLGEAVQIETVQGGGLWRAFVDRAQLESAVLNLAVNARDAMDGAGKLTIETANVFLDRQYADAHGEITPGQYVMVAVTDTGCGMTANVINKAFDPFFTTKAVGQGTGLGLSQVHGFARQSNGHVKIYSEPGVGTTVKLYLPKDTSKPEECEVAASAEPLSPAVPCKVLVVEDDAGVREFVVSVLQELGYEPVAADNADAARKQLADDSEIAVMLTDVVMPGDNGRQLFEDVKESRPELAVLFMTGYTRNAIVHNGVLDAGVRLISKPFTIEELSRELHAVIGASAAAMSGQAHG